MPSKAPPFFSDTGGETLPNVSLFLIEVKRMRNIKDAYKKAHLSWNADNEFQLKKDVDAVRTDVDALETLVDKIKNLVSATVTFDSKGGSSVQAQVVQFGQKATKPTPDPTKANNRFVNWFEGESATPFNFNINIEANKTLDAHWVDVYTVTYSLNEGTGTLPTQDPCAEGETFTCASSEGITKEGKVFGGWSDGTNTYEAGATYTMGSANVTLTAVWNDEE